VKGLQFCPQAIQMDAREIRRIALEIPQRASQYRGRSGAVSRRMMMQRDRCLRHALQKQATRSARCAPRVFQFSMRLEKLAAVEVLDAAREVFANFLRMFFVQRRASMLSLNVTFKM
jgi:hypothetical protein